LNQRPLGYEGKFALHTDQKDPTGTNNDEDLRGDEVVPCWFGSVRLLHRDFIGGSEPPCGFFPGSLRAARSSLHRVPSDSDLPRRGEAQRVKPPGLSRGELWDHLPHILDELRSVFQTRDGHQVASSLPCASRSVALPNEARRSFEQHRAVSERASGTRPLPQPRRA
jgi:hypothetical protein